MEKNKYIYFRIFQRYLILDLTEIKILLNYTFFYGSLIRPVATVHNLVGFFSDMFRAIIIFFLKTIYWLSKKKKKITPIYYNI